MDDLFRKPEGVLIGCLPILCLKENNGENSFLNEIYKRVPKADYYMGGMGGMGGSKPALGTYQVLKTPEKPSILNCCVKTYPGSELLKSDNLEKRKTYFEKILIDVRKKYPTEALYFSAFDIKGMEDIASLFRVIILPDDQAEHPAEFDPKDIQNVILYPTDYVIMSERNV